MATSITPWSTKYLSSSQSKRETRSANQLEEVEAFGCVHRVGLSSNSGANERLSNSVIVGMDILKLQKACDEDIPCEAAAQRRSGLPVPSLASQYPGSGQLRRGGYRCSMEVSQTKRCQPSKVLFLWLHTSFGITVNTRKRDRSTVPSRGVYPGCLRPNARREHLEEQWHKGEDLYHHIDRSLCPRRPLSTRSPAQSRHAIGRTSTILEFRNLFHELCGQAKYPHAKMGYLE